MTSSQCDPRPGQDDAIGGDARERPPQEPKRGYQLTWKAAIDWARNCAKPGPGGMREALHTPRSLEESETWLPPDWLIIAIQGAYARGQRNADTPAAAPPEPQENAVWNTIAQRAAGFIDVTKAFHDGAAYLSDAINATGIDNGEGEALYVGRHGVHVQHRIVVVLNDGSRLVFDLEEGTYLRLRKDES